MSPPGKRNGPLGRGPIRGSSGGWAAGGSVPGPCPDCAAPVVDGHLDHAATCPIGLAADARVAEDRRWFQEHPGAKRYLRPLAADEIAELRLAGVIPPGWGVAGDVEIVEIRPGVRTRRFDACWMFPPQAPPTRASAEDRYAQLANEALATGDVATDGELIAVPDVVLAEGLANGMGDPPPAPTLQRADGRTVAFYRMPGGAA